MRGMRTHEMRATIHESTVTGMSQKLFKSETTVADSGLCGMSRDQKFQAEHEFEDFKC